MTYDVVLVMEVATRRVHIHAAPIPHDRDRRCLPTVRLLAISSASREPKGGGVDTFSEGKSHATPGVALVHGEKPCVLNGLEKRGGVGGPGWRVRCERPVTEIIDRRQPAVMRAGVAGPASPGERAPSCGGGRGAPPRRKVSHRDRRQRADALSRDSLPNTEFRSETITPASPRDAERDHLLRPLQHPLF